MKAYVKPEVKIDYYKGNDIIVTSTCQNSAGNINQGHGTGQNGCGQGNGKGYCNSTGAYYFE